VTAIALGYSQRVIAGSPQLTRPGSSEATGAAGNRATGAAAILGPRSAPPMVCDVPEAQLATCLPYRDRPTSATLSHCSSGTRWCVVCPDNLRPWRAFRDAQRCRRSGRNAAGTAWACWSSRPVGVRVEYATPPNVSGARMPSAGVRSGVARPGFLQDCQHCRWHRLIAVTAPPVAWA
jgi:hypothetical protein